MKRKYELMLVLHPDVDAKDTKKQDEIVNALVANADVTIEEKTVIGKKTLAYPIKKQTEGLYMLYMLAGEAVKVGDVEAAARLTPTVLRYLLIAK